MCSADVELNKSVTERWNASLNSFEISVQFARISHEKDNLRLLTIEME